MDNNNSLNKSASNKIFSGSVPITREKLQARARELAVITGRDSMYVLQMDYEEAKRELTGDWDLIQPDTPVESPNQKQPNDRLAGSTGHQSPETPSEDEDNEGRNETVRLVIAGIKKAERDQILEAAALHAAKKDT